MSDIVERLLVMAEEAAIPCGEPFEDLVVGYCTEAADEITRLRSLLKEAGEALEAIVARWDTPAWKDTEPTAEVINRARTVLSKIKGEA